MSLSDRHIHLSANIEYLKRISEVTLVSAARELTGSHMRAAFHWCVQSRGFLE